MSQYDKRGNVKRLIDYYLQEWKNSSRRKSLLLRGARQVGKTYAVRQLGRQYENFVEINFELMPHLHGVFDQDLHPERIIKELSYTLKTQIKAGNTLLFFDEVQAQPKAIIALRYFYELMPELHVIAAGSLLDFAIEKVGIPVGRVQSLYVYPVSFIEFLAAAGYVGLAQEILDHDVRETMSEVLHEKLLDLLGNYMAIGGMPEAVDCWLAKQDLFDCAPVGKELIVAYRQDFGKYARTAQIKYVELIFNQVPLQQGQKFKFSAIDGEYRKRELSPALDLLETAGIVHKVYNSSGQGIPLGAEIDPQHFKANFLDVGLSQTVLGLETHQWFLNPLQEYINKGSLVEAFVGQELLAYSDPVMKRNLYFWQRESRASQAEVDYLQQLGADVIPIEVKSGPGTALKSMRIFLESHKNSPYGIRLSTQNYSLFEQLHSYPLYAVARIMSMHKSDAKAALLSLLE